MKLNRKRVLTGLVATGLVAGALTGGGMALAGTGATPAPATSAAAGPPDGYGMGAGQFGGMHGMWPGEQPALAAAATYLGLTPTQLRDQLQAGKSLADVATAQGKAVPGLKDAILAAITSRINASAALTAGQKAAMLTQMKTHLDTMVDMDMTHPTGVGYGPMGSSMGGMWR